MIILLGIKLSNGHAFFYYDKDYFHIAQPYRDSNITLSSYSGSRVVIESNDYTEYYLECQTMGEMVDFVRSEHQNYISNKIRKCVVPKEWKTMSPKAEETMFRMMQKAIDKWIPDGNRDGATKLLTAVVNLPNLEQREHLVLMAKKLEIALT